jgi:hypothetical protein
VKDFRVALEFRCANVQWAWWSHDVVEGWRGQCIVALTCHETPPQYVDRAWRAWKRPLVERHKHGGGQLKPARQRGIIDVKLLSRRLAEMDNKVRTDQPSVGGLMPAAHCQ